MVFPSLQARPRALAYIRSWMERHCAGRKVVTITLRESGYEQARNSRVQEWAAFVHMLNCDEYYPVIIRDTNAALEPVPHVFRDLPVLTDVCWNLELRMALYEISHLNLFQNNGPYILCAFNRKSRYINTTQANVTGSGATDENHFRSQGIEPGKHQNRWSTPLQELAWGDDRAELIYQAFTELNRRIDFYETAPLQELLNEFEDYRGQEYYHRAEWLAEQAVKRFAEESESWLMRARILHQLKVEEDALSCVQNAVRLKETPAALSELLSIGRSLQMKQEVEQVEYYIKQKYPDWQGLPVTV
jgi:tetratricopeptide (TPR) repeat protein